MEIQPDIGAEIIESLGEIGRGIKKAKADIAEKDAKIVELESKLQKYENGSKKIS